jgi:hypothetical protein
MQSLQKDVELAGWQHTKQFEFKFPIRDVSGDEIKETEIAAAILGFIKSKNRYNLPEQTKKRFLFDVWDIKHFSFNTQVNNNSFIMQYISGLRVKTRTMGGSVYVSEKNPTIFEIAFPYQAMKEGDNYRFVINYPTKGTLTISDEDIEPLDNIENLKADVQRIYMELANSTVTIKRIYKLREEVNSQFNDTSILANFRRILGKYIYDDKTKMDDVVKERTFSFKYNNIVLPLEVEVYPYRNGSKAVYNLKIPYFVDSKGNISLIPYQIDEIKKQMEKIVND